jgi:hypothetical protein
MATFIPGVTDYIPQFQNDIPDLGLIQQTLKIKQSQYDANYAKIKSIQDSLLNAKLSRDDTKETRKAFMEAADKAIKQISTVDLSKPQNVSVAERIFDPLINNQLFLKDVAATKIAAAELQKGYDARECADPKKCNDGYNPESEEAINYWLENFKNMTPEEALKANPIRYVYDPKIPKRLTDLIKEIEPSAKVTEVQGQWIVKTKMGDEVQAHLNSILHNAIASDPQVQEYMRNKASVQRERFIRSSGLPRAEADIKYNEEILTSIDKSTAEDLKNINTSIEKIQFQAKQLVDASGGKVPKGSRTMQRIEQFSQIIEMLESNKESILERQQEFESFKENANAAQIDNQVSSLLLSNQIRSFAKSYSALKKEVDIDANPFAVNEQKFNYDVAIEKMRDQNDKDNIILRARMDMAKEQFKFNLENAANIPGVTPEGGVQLMNQGESATRPIDEIEKHNRDQALAYATQAQKGQKEYLITLYQNLSPADRAKLFKKQDGAVYNMEELQNLDPKTLQDGPKGKVSTLTMLYRSVSDAMAKTASTTVPNIQGQLTALKTSIDLNETASKEAISAFNNNRILVYARLMTNPEFTELMQTIASSNIFSQAEIKKLFSSEDGSKGINEDALKELIIKETPSTSSSAEMTNPLGLVLTPLFEKISSTKMFNKKLGTLLELQDILTRAKSKAYNSSTTKPKIIGADLKLDQLGNPVISYPAIGIPTTVSSTDTTPEKKTTLSMLESLYNVATNEPGSKIKFYYPDGNEYEELEVGADVIAQLKAGFSNPQKSNVLQINSIERSENLTYKKEYDDSKVLYKINIAPTTAEAIAKTTGKNVKEVSQIIVEVDKNSDRSSFVNATSNFNAANTVLKGGGKITQTVEDPISGDSYELNLFRAEDGQIYSYLNFNGVFKGNSYIPIGSSDPEEYILQGVKSISTGIATKNNKVANENQNLQTDFVSKTELYNLLRIK